MPGSRLWRFFPDAEQLCQRLRDNQTRQSFSPREERVRVLRAWLIYRGYAKAELLHQTHANVVNLCLVDMHNRGNTPHFGKFTAFDPADASLSFLTKWLAWYGITSTTPRPRAWWDDTTRYIQTHVMPPKQESIKALFRRYVQARRAVIHSRKMMRDLTLILDTLPEDHPLLTQPARYDEQDSKHLLAMLIGADFSNRPSAVAHRSKKKLGRILRHRLASFGADMDVGELRTLRGQNPRLFNHLSTVVISSIVRMF